LSLSVGTTRWGDLQPVQPLARHRSISLSTLAVDVSLDDLPEFVDAQAWHVSIA